MSTTKNAKTPARPQETTPSITKGTDIEILNNPEMLKLLAGIIKPLVEFHQVGEQMMEDDVVFFYSVKAIRGKNTFFKQVQGISTLNGLLATDRLVDALPTVELEMKDKIVIPMVGAFQDYVNRIALDLVAADRKARAAADDLTDNDLR